MKAPTLVWFRRDLRLSDHQALQAALARGAPVIPVFLNDGRVSGLGTAPQWRLGQGLAHFAQRLEAAGSRLICRSGDGIEILPQLVRETGAQAVYWSRAYDPDSVARDTRVKSALQSEGVTAQSFGGHLLFEPWSVETGQGGFYRVYSPFWRAVRGRDVVAPLAAPSQLPAPDTWPDSENPADWALGAGMRRGADIVARHIRLGEEAAQARLAEFCAYRIADYIDMRNVPAADATSGLSENLSLGEISPAQCWHAGQRAMQEGKGGAEHFLKEIVWREFAYHLMWHTPQILTDNWRSDWDSFPWSEDADSPEVMAWKQGRTGIPFVDAAMREMYVTGRMHNRARMIAASYLTKHLMQHWRTGLRWFEDCLTDWDPASNAMGWQWVAGSGPDAAPYFRIFNPDSQLDKFDRDRAYTKRWIAEGHGTPDPDALSYFDAVPLSWNLSPEMPYPAPVVSTDAGRKRALAAYEARDF